MSNSSSRDYYVSRANADRNKVERALIPFIAAVLGV